MKLFTANAVLAASLLVLFGVMLATPLIKSNARQLLPLRADSAKPMPPPPWQGSAQLSS